MDLAIGRNSATISEVCGRSISPNVVFNSFSRYLISNCPDFLKNDMIKTVQVQAKYHQSITTF